MDPLITSFAGAGLSLQEQVAFRTACRKTQIDEKSSTAPVFWGKINGIALDYLIASKFESSFGQIRKTFYVYKYV
jgi:hypothetical protein